jgi:hypothetical protein
MLTGMSNYYANKGMQSIPKSVLDAVEKESYLPALALALTIPDVYGRIEYPPKPPQKDGVHVFTRNGKECTEPCLKPPSTLSHYQKWFDNYVYGYDSFKALAKIPPKFKPFNGYYCYLLRCKVLHESTHDIHPNNKHPLDFELRIGHDSAWNPAEGIGTIEEYGEVTYQLRIDPVHLSQALANAALAYENEIMEKNDQEKLERLEEHHIDVVDLDEFASANAHVQNRARGK